ncbi:MAG: SENSORY TRANSDUCTION HISTIDINE KINASE [uncultured Sulfurovum sp.]|uniref:SENSORY TRANSDUCTION HISTIDINE KINASE n=1 Tax=uncultured Sulfurovum sp. TaxID=269237 RepID=A0A6S6TK48_9BACT|nr:MAG: SENSORY TRANSDUCTION HISTIDINE KINASE [uncultured Sulfurovum sp.]
MDDTIELPNSEYIDTNLGLKYLNGNKALYLKVLNSFLTRYQNLDITLLNENEVKSTMHTIKGLSSTLGMEQLSTIAKALHDTQTEELTIKFSATLKLIMTDLNKSQKKSILIVDKNYNDIDTMVSTLENQHDLIIGITIEDAQQSLSEEKIDLVLLSTELSNLEIIDTLKQKDISFISLQKPLNMPIITEKIKNI